MYRNSLPIIQVDPTPSTRVNTISAVGNVAIPTLDGGLPAKFCYIQATADTRGEAVWISPQIAATNGAKATGIPIVTGSNGLLLHTWGSSHIGYDYDSGRAPAKLRLYITPIHNQDPRMPAIQIEPNSGKQVVATTTGASTTIPTVTGTEEATYTLIQSVLGTGTVVGEAIHVSPEQSAVAGDIATGIPVVFGTDPIILNTHGYTHIGYDLYTAAGTNGFLNLIPLAIQ